MADDPSELAPRFGRWKLLHDEAVKFLESPFGVLLHELGHHASANARDLVAGHIVIDRSGHYPRGAFVISDELVPQRPSGKQKAFTLASGAMTELEFAGLTNPSRLVSDIGAFTALAPGTSLIPGDAALIGLWIQLFGREFAELTDEIAANHRACTAVMRSATYRLRGYDVIPTHILNSKSSRDRLAVHREVVATEPIAARMRALERYVRAQSINK